jgi:hypothetical protein
MPAEATAAVVGPREAERDVAQRPGDPARPLVAWVTALYAAMLAIAWRCTA